MKIETQMPFFQMFDGQNLLFAKGSMLWAGLVERSMLHRFPDFFNFGEQVAGRFFKKRGREISPNIFDRLRARMHHVVAENRPAKPP